MLRSGLVGLQLPALQPTVMALARGDLLILATDGIRAGYEAGLNLGELPQRIADRILKQYFKGTDDGLVLVARYVGVAP
jgi:hypothetical protein